LVSSRPHSHTPGIAPSAAPGADFGLFGPSSMAWRIHGDPASLIGGLRALLVQGLKPEAMAAVDQHSDYREDPWARLRATSDYLVATTFGDTATAEAWGARVRSIHRRVRGIDPVTKRPYRADDPELLLWVHAVEVHSFLTAYRHYAGTVTDADADRYVREMIRAAELVGLHAEDVPASLGALRDYLRAVDDLALTPAAKEGARYVLSPPMPLAARPLWVVAAIAAVAILPRRARRLYGLPWFEPARPIVRASVFTLMRALNLAVPPPVRVRRALTHARSMLE
jgi:uncharacterized protein (DUF2236 family)